MTRLLEGAAALDPALLETMRGGLERALDGAFLTMAAAAAATLIVSFLMPNLDPDETDERPS